MRDSSPGSEVTSLSHNAQSCDGVSSDRQLKLSQRREIECSFTNAMSAKISTNYDKMAAGIIQNMQHTVKEVSAQFE